VSDFSATERMERMKVNMNTERPDGVIGGQGRTADQVAADATWFAAFGLVALILLGVIL